MSLRSVNLGKLLREAPQNSSAATAPLKLKGLLADTEAPVAGKPSTARNRKIIARWAGLVVIVGVMLSIVLVLFGPTMIRVIPSAIPTSRQKIDAPKPGADRAVFSKPVQELMDYVQCLKGQMPKLGCRFSADITGEEAAKQFGYSRLFASVYEEMSWRVKVEEKKKNLGNAGRSGVVAGFEDIVHEEQAIDQLMARNERYGATVAYLRALENGDVVFPGPQPLAPIPAVLLVQLMSAYPDVKFDINDPVFAEVYRRTRDFAAARVRESGEVWAEEIIAEFRRLTVKSAGEE